MEEQLLTPHDETAAEIEKLWNSSDPNEWQRALDRYWRYVKPSHLALEQEMETLDPTTVAHFDAVEWHDWLLRKYFVWKYTAPNRYATTTMHLERQAQAAGMEHLRAIRDRILAASGSSIRDALRVATLVKGLGTAGASGLLALLFPSKFGTVDQFALGSLLKIRRLPERELLMRMKPEGLTIKDGVVLIEVMRAKALALNAQFRTDYWTPRKIDKILWSSERK